MSTPTNIGMVSIRLIDEETPRPHAPSVYDEWGEMAPEIQSMVMMRWLVELQKPNGEIAIVGDMSAHAVWYGPTLTSKAMNIGISLVEEFRGLGFGAKAQNLLALELHNRGFIRVEAQTDITNIAEQKSLRKAGFQFEGVAQQSQGRADGIHDLQVWSHIEGLD